MATGATTIQPPEAPTVFIVDDDVYVRATLKAILEDDGRHVRDFATGEEFIERYRPGVDGCLLADVNLPGMDGVELLRRMNDRGEPLPTIIITGNGCIPMAVEAMRAGATDVMEKPIGTKELLARVEQALVTARRNRRRTRGRQVAAGQIARLTPRQQQIMEMVLAGAPSKNIAADLGISQRTVENHRAVIMRKTGAKSLPELARLALAATGEDTSAF
jgi:two-component system CheB/CheR fusion protein